MEPRYPALRRYVSETPWALHPSTLLLLRDVIARRIDGDRLTAEEIAEITAAAPKRNATPAQGSIAVLPLWGILSPHQVNDISSGPTTALDSWMQQFDELVNDPSVGTIVLDVDSPGGSVDLVPETAAKVRAANAKKDIVAVANTRIASAAYWIASQAGQLVVSPSGAVGSIGVYAAHEDVSEQLAAEGVTVTLISAGDHKVDGNPFQPLTDEARATIQANVDAFYAMFVGDVAQGRGVDQSAVEKKFGQGKMVLAADAVNARMADGVGTLEQTLQRLLGGKPAAARRARAAELEPALAATGAIGTTTARRLLGGEIAVSVPALALAAAAELSTAALDIVPYSLEVAALASGGGSDAGGVVPVHHTKVIDKPWDGPAQVAELNRPVTKARGFGMFAWYDKNGADPDGDGYPDAKADWKFPHHDVAGGEPGPAVVSACRNGLPRLENSEIPDADKSGVKAHLQAHIDDFNQNSGGSAAGSAAPGGDNTRKEKTMAKTIAELAGRREEIAARLRELEEKAEETILDGEEAEEFDALLNEAAEISETLKGDEARREKARGVYETKTESRVRATPQPDRGGVHSNVDSKIPDDLHALGEYRKLAGSVDEMLDLQKDGARRIAEKIRFVKTPSQDRAHEHVEDVLVGSADCSDEKGQFARRVILCGDPNYEKAFLKAVMRGRDALSDSEDRLIKAAITESGLGSETPVPITIDPTVALTSSGATNPIRALAREVTISGLTYRGITSGGMTMAYEAEGNQVADQTPTLGGTDVSVIRADGYCAFSIEIDQDWGALRGELAREFADAKDVLEASKFVIGSGSGEPEGIVTALTASTAPVVVIKTAATATFAIDDPDLLTTDLPPRFDPGASWIASKAVWTKIESLTRALGNADPFSFAVEGIPAPPDGLGNVSRIFRGYPVYNASTMDTAYATSGKNIMVLGDFSRGMVIVDRIGLNVELIPLVLGSNQRPTGERALYVYYRNNTAVPVVNAFRLLQVL